MHSVLAALGALVPPVGVGLVFWFALRAIIRADRTERAAIARIDAAEAGGHMPQGPAQKRSPSPSPTDSSTPAAE